MSVIDGVATKYMLSYLGWLIIAPAFLDGSEEGGIKRDSVETYNHYHIVSRMMTNLSSAIGSLACVRDVVRCLGVGSRIASFEDRLEYMLTRH